MTKIKLKLCKLYRSPGFNKFKNIILLTLPFLLMDFFIRLLSTGVKYHIDSMVFPNIVFTVIWGVLIISAALCFGKKAGRIIYGTVFGILFILFMTHAVYYPYTGFFFSFNLLQSAEEGSAYILDTLLKAGVMTYVMCITVLVSGIIAIIKFPSVCKKRIKTFIVIFICFVILHFVTPTFLGKANKSLEWDTWRNPRNVYENFSDSNKNIKICGFLEYTARDFYVTFLRPDDKENPEELEFLSQAYETETLHAENEFTGIFEGKNVIFLQLEGIDTWLLNKNDMPNLYGMLSNSIVFDNHYSYYTGGGSTFNSELAVTTGFLTPISYTQNPYSFNTNYFPSSLPTLLKKNGYRVHAFHMNSGEYYMRELNYRNWGYIDYFSLMDDGNYKDLSYQLDSELILNDTFNRNLFCQRHPFMNYVITYTNHTPFNLDSPMAKLLTERKYGKVGQVPSMNEEQVTRFFASETDNMVGLLLKELKDYGLIEDTVIVSFADHYLYTLNDKTILDKYKTTGNNLINRTPFFIWSYDMNPKHVNKVNSQLDILPTVLNMFGIEYYDEHYIGRDIMDRDYKGYVFFSDYSWYDGKNYVEFGEVTNNQSADSEYINQTNTLINNLIRKNDLTLKYDYFRKKKDN